MNSEVTPQRRTRFSTQVKQVSSKYPEKILARVKGHSLHVVLCLLLSLALAMLPLELTPKVDLQLTKYRCVGSTLTSHKNKVLNYRSG